MTITSKYEINSQFCNILLYATIPFFLIENHTHAFYMAHQVVQIKSIPSMSFLTGIPRISRSKLAMLALIKDVWDFQSNEIRDVLLQIQNQASHRTLYTHIT